jgi:formate/nitrite transporter FocA (FNT family)
VIESESVIVPVEITAHERPGWQDSAALLTTGVLAGVYLLFTAAWVITALRNPIAIADPLGSFMFTLGLWLAAVAGPLTFTAIVVWRRGRGVGLRLLWLVIGALVLIPWPYVSWVG